MELNQVNYKNTSTPATSMLLASALPMTVTHSPTSLSVSKLTNNDLESGLKNLIQQERKLLHLILLHIKEVENRKLYLRKAYPSLFEYLVKEYGYSAGGAMRRIEAARLLRDVPQMAQKIQAGLINLSQITEISRAVKEKQKESKVFISKQEKEDLVLKVVGLNLAETQKVVSFELNIKPKEFEKKRTQKDESVRLELTLTKEQMRKLNQCKDLAGHILEQKRMGTSLAAVIEVLTDQFLAKRGPGGGGDGHKPCVDHESKFISNVGIKNLKSNPEIKMTEAACVYNLEVNQLRSDAVSSLKVGQMRSAAVSKLEMNQIQSVTISKLEVGEIKIDTILNLEENSEKNQVANKAIQQKINTKTNSMKSSMANTIKKLAINSNSTLNSTANSNKTSQPNKTLTAKTKIKIHNRDKCCQYIDPLTKKKCESTYKLEIDHKKPQWAEGDHQESNLQVLCKNHNSYKYKIEAGFI